MGNPSIIFAYSPSVHDQINALVSQSIFYCKPGCQDFIKKAQRSIDSRGAKGDKRNGRLYLHYIQLIDGFPQSVHDKILRELGLTGRKNQASPDDFIRAAELRGFSFIAQKINGSKGKLSHQETGKILYILAVLTHAHQDRKHMEGNITDRKKDGLTSTAHYTWDFHQLFSDPWPSSASRKRALKRTTEFFQRFRSEMKKQTGLYYKEAFKRIGNFKMGPGKEVYDYKPSAKEMDYLFPDYPTRDKETQAHWSLRPGYFWGRGRSGLTLDIGGQYHLPRLGLVRPQANLGLAFTRDFNDRTEYAVKGSVVLGDYVDLFGAGISGTIGITDSEKFFYGLEGVIKFLEGNFVFQMGRYWYPGQPNEIRYSLFVDAFAVARSFEWLDRNF